MTHTNLILDTDSYKLSHAAAYPPEMRKMVIYMEPRTKGDNDLVFFGLQGLLNDWANNPITRADVDEAYELAALHFGRSDVLNRDGWNYIADNYGGGLPLTIEALPEGTKIKGSNLMVKVSTTDPRVAWLAMSMETQLMRLWSDTTVATKSYHLKQLLHTMVVKTADDANAAIPFMLHDFGSRGVSSRETAGRAGLAHLVNFMGTDTMQTFASSSTGYGTQMPGFSIPAMEHSTIMAWGRDREIDAYRNFLVQWGKPGAILAMVMDSYDQDNAVRNIICQHMAQEIRSSGAKVMIRLDSGEPVHEVMKALGYLVGAFGYTQNKKGYMVLKHVGVVLGNKVSKEVIEQVLQAMIDGGFCTTNIVFGMGGGLLQLHGRDDFGFAIKPCMVVNGDEVIPVFKSPKTDLFKRSKGGNLDVIDVYGEGLITIDRLTDPRPHPTQLVPYYENGQILRHDTLEQIRLRAGA
jgi:nicotinamide phosphoribosyltransferase